jgi:hypothetical protein
MKCATSPRCQAETETQLVTGDARRIGLTIERRMATAPNLIEFFRLLASWSEASRRGVRPALDRRDEVAR